VPFIPLGGFWWICCSDFCTWLPATLDWCVLCLNHCCAAVLLRTIQGNPQPKAFTNASVAETL